MPQTLIDVAHNITPDKVLFCYRRDDEDSLEIARYYADKRLLEPQQLCPLDVPASYEIDYSLYVDRIEGQILAWMQRALIDSEHHTTISPFCIILGYRVPVVVDYYGEKLAVASRLHRLGHAVSPKSLNHTYDRKEYQYFEILR